MRNDHDLGTLERRGEECTLTFHRHLAHPPAKVWRAVTEPEHLRAWFPQVMLGERRAGASLRFLTSPDGAEGFDGEMLVFEPPTVMELLWGTDRLRVELLPDGDGTLLTLTDTFTPVGKAARDAAGWHECLDRLAADLDGTVAPDAGSVWQAVHPAYVERLGPDAATIGPPAGADPSEARR